jgi:hypothetical protein
MCSVRVLNTADDRSSCEQQVFMLSVQELAVQARAVRRCEFSRTATFSRNDWYVQSGTRVNQ